GSPKAIRPSTRPLARASPPVMRTPSRVTSTPAAASAVTAGGWMPIARGRSEISVRCSSTTTSAPPCARSTAASMPTGPPPTIATSRTGHPDGEEAAGECGYHSPPGGRDLAQFDGGEAAAQRCQTVGANVRAGEERCAEDAERDVREAIACEVAVHAHHPGVLVRLLEELPDVVEVVQHVVRDDEVERLLDLVQPRPPKGDAGHGAQRARKGVSARVGVDADDAQPKRVAARPARESPCHVAAAAAHVEEGALLGRTQQGADEPPVRASPPRDDRVEHPESRVGAPQHPLVAVGVVHVFDEVGFALPHEACAPHPQFAVMRPDSTVSPGPNAMAQIRSPGCAVPRMCLSTKSTVALLMLPKSRRVSREGTSCASLSPSDDSTRSRMLRPPGWIAQCSMSGTPVPWENSGVSADSMYSPMIFGT